MSNSKYFHILYKNDWIEFTDGQSTHWGKFTGKRLGELALKQKEMYEVVLPSKQLSLIEASSVTQIVNSHTNRPSFKDSTLQFDGLIGSIGKCLLCIECT